MTQCPKCQAALKDDYGMVTCPSCGSILFIDMEGIAHMGQEEAPASSHDEPAPHVEEEPAPFEPVASAAFDEPAFHFETPAEAHVETGAEEPAPLLEPLPDIPVDASYDGGFAVGGETVETPFEVPADEPVAYGADEPAAPAEAAPEAAPDNFSMDSFLGFGDPAPAEESASVAQEAPTSPDDPLGLNDFANSEISQAKDGFLMFRVHIAGIDSKEIRESIREAIVDQRFAWDAAQIMSTISKGVLKIDRLSPIKATILVSRIKRLPVQIRWEQYAITQAETEEPSTDNESGGESY